MTVKKGTFDKKDSMSFDPKKTEIFIALIAPIGTDLEKVHEYLKKSLVNVDYGVHRVKLSSLISKNTSPPISSATEFERIQNFMKAGNDLREKVKDGSVVAKLAVDEIASIRQAISGDSTTPAGGHAYIIDSLKHDKEVEFLRNTYGQFLSVMSVYEPYGIRLESLLKKNAPLTQSRIPLSEDPKARQALEEEAGKILNYDRGESQSAYGQNVGKAFHLADVFISTKNETITGFNVEKQINRFINLLFGAPFITPTKDEYGSFYAHAAALRSADLSRQVGATITTKDGELISAGCNEVPCAGGGAYWEGTPEGTDYRDFKEGIDANAQMKNENVKEIFEALKQAGWLSDGYKNKTSDELLDAALYKESPPAILRDTGIANIIEFGRIVHAEMTAITDAARRGIALKGATLYTTTFPCHVCARHILASGIQRVVYIEPYPKSHAGSQYRKSIKIDDDEEADSNAVQFDAFMGIAPRVFMQLFAKVERKTRYGRAHPEEPRLPYPKIHSQFAHYIDIESLVIADLAESGTIKRALDSNTNKGEGKNV